MLLLDIFDEFVTCMIIVPSKNESQSLHEKRTLVVTGIAAKSHDCHY